MKKGQQLNRSNLSIIFGETKVKSLKYELDYPNEIGEIFKLMRLF